MTRRNQSQKTTAADNQATTGGELANHLLVNAETAKKLA